MESFFNVDVVDDIAVPKTLKIRKEIYYSCDTCGLYKNCSHGRMPYTGRGDKQILIVLACPTIKADRLGAPAVGGTKRILKSLCKKNGLDYDNDVWVVNAVQCHFTKHKTAVQACRQRLHAVIKNLKPKSIIAVGAQALDGLLGDKLSIGEAMHQWNGWAIPFHEYKTVVYPTYGTQDLIVDGYNSVMEIKMGCVFAQAQSPTYINYVDMLDIKILTSVSEIKNCLLNMETAEIVSFDYETTGLQPYKHGHDIVCMSVSDGRTSYAFMKTHEIEAHIRHFLESSVPKIAHNAKFEGLWGKHILGVDINNIVADTMITTHCLNNNKGINSLKFQGSVRFGIHGYGDEMKTYWGDNKDVHAFNKLFYLKQQGELYTIENELLYYCGMDSLLTHWLYTVQKREIAQTPHVQAGIDLFLRGMKAFIDIEYEGMHVNIECVHKNIEKVSLKLNALEQLIYSTDEVNQWNEQHPFNFKSDLDLPILLYDILGYRVHKYTKTKQRSVDVEALEKIVEETKSEFLILLMKYRHLYKIKNTYLEGIHKGTVDEFIHPSFNLHTARTMRSSSSRPFNAQNLPKRSEIAKNLVRTVFIADTGCFLDEIDFSGLEVGIGACIHKDPTMLEYLTPPIGDFHADSACDLFLRTPKTLRADERQVTKSGFTFAIQYGSWYEACAKYLWENMSKPSKAHLVRKGYTTLEKYTEIVKRAEDIFWNERFQVFGKWVESNWKKYNQHGYIDTQTGFRVTALMSKNQTSNIDTQGSAFHCVLWLMLYIHDELKRRQLKSRVILEVHDSILLNRYSEEKDEVQKIIVDGLNALVKAWDWIILPLSLKYEQSPIDGNWAQIKETGGTTSK